MADQAEQVSNTGLVDTKQQPGATKRRQYSEALKRQLVAETQAPGASVSIAHREIMVVADDAPEQRAWLQAADAPAVLVRPDRYVLGAARSLQELNTLVAAL
jgi:3-(3-hydroxy-phenyl)propionate hydroxylase